MDARKPVRYGGVIYVNEEKLEEYKKLHSAVWPAVLDRLAKSNIRNFTIYFCKELGVLFSHMEYIGDDIEKDKAAIAADPTTKEWWKVCEPCQKPLQWDGPPPSQGGTGGDWWAPLEEVFHDNHTPTSYT
ncbi:L-rhamnose mutarotase-like [Styela clava]